MVVDDPLSPDVRTGASLRGNEYGWIVSAFPNALSKAENVGYACLGGQFQFRLDDGRTCEMYWLNADAPERAEGESWADYSRRSCAEVLQRFQCLVSETDFQKEASSWPVPIDPVKNLVFVAYFVREKDWAEL
ncbi:MAG TPA: hypothetical protein VMD77_15455 [Candidatus Baltobacteraceae bacterium]|nr:hypothetical protein [Candidatus Baltobacteraceae bacterium]